MNLKNLNDSNLVQKVKTLVAQERELLTSILHHLREIDRRRLYSSLGYKSLFDFTTRPWVIQKIKPIAEFVPRN